MIRLSRAQIQPIGLDVGHDAVRMVQLERVGTGLRVAAAARHALPAEAKAKPELRMPLAMDLVRQMFRRGNFRGRRVVAALPRSIVHVKNLRLPPIPPAEMEKVVQFEAKNILPFDPARARVHFLPAGEVRQGAEVRQEVVLLAARNEDVGEYLEHLHGAGAVVESLDVEACALYRTIDRFIRRREDEQEVYVLLDVGASRSQVVIGKGREISFVKAIDVGGRAFNEAVARKLGITPDEAQSLRRRLVESADPGAAAREAAKTATQEPNPKGAGDSAKTPPKDPPKDPVRLAAFDATRSVMEDLGREISLCLRYYSVTFRGCRPARLRLVGGEACDGQLQALLSNALTIPVEVGRPLYSIDTSAMKPAERRGPQAEWATALGLGLKFLEGPFGARDGKPRDAQAPPASPRTPGAEVIDLAAAIRATDGDAAAPRRADAAPAVAPVPPAASPDVPIHSAPDPTADVAVDAGRSLPPLAGAELPGPFPPNPRGAASDDRPGASSPNELSPERTDRLWLAQQPPVAQPLRETERRGAAAKGRAAVPIEATGVAAGSGPPPEPVSVPARRVSWWVESQVSEAAAAGRTGEGVAPAARSHRHRMRAAREGVGGVGLAAPAAAPAEGPHA